ncbi:MAG: LysE family transporter [Candidatus Aminicenantales bacterium]
MYIFLGLLIGFLAAIPLGPVNVFVISQTLKRNFFHGFLAGLTAATLDLIYCLIAIIGIAHITLNVADYLPLMKILTSLLLLAIGYRLLKQSKNYTETTLPKKITSISPRPMIGVILLYVSNPSLYVFWIGVGSMVTSHYWVLHTGKTPFIFAVACGLGGALWYFMLCRYVSRHHHQFKSETLRKIFLALAIILFAFALYTASTIFFKVRLP